MIYLFLKFIIYSFIGYIAEVIYCSFIQKKFVNRGFLFGPLCPIYGIGAILMINSLSNLKESPVLVFFLGMIITSCLEYYTSYIFEKIFNNKWWDYSEKPDNINGRICLSNSILFGVGGLVVIYLLEPIINNFLNIINPNINIIFIIILIVFIIDVLFSIIIAYNLRNKLIVAEELKVEKLMMIPNLFIKNHQKQFNRIKIKTNRLIKNYPNLAKDLRKELMILKDMLIDNKNNKKNVKKTSKSRKK